LRQGAERNVLVGQFAFLGDRIEGRAGLDLVAGFLRRLRSSGKTICCTSRVSAVV